MTRIYLDYNASTPIDPQVLEVMIEELKNEKGNPSSIHYEGKRCRQQLESARESIAHYFSCKPSQIFFTSGGTEGAALLLHQTLLQKKGHVITSSVEHACIYQFLKEFEKGAGEVTFLPTGEWGAVLPDAVERAIKPHTTLITLMAVNNETGVMTDLEGIAAIARKHKIPFIVDGVAWLGKEQIQIPEGISALFFSGHKIHAPKGIGFCMCRPDFKIHPLFVGGGQESNRRAGTENLPGIVALGAAIEQLKENENILPMRRLRDLLEQRLMAALPNVLINGSGPRVCNTSNLAFIGVNGESLLMHLDLAGISVSHGSACASGALEPSRILLEMGLPRSRVNSSIRFSLGRITTEAEILQASDRIIQIIQKLKS